MPFNVVALRKVEAALYTIRKVSMMNRTVSHRFEQFARLGGKMVHGTAWTRLAMASLLLGALALLLIGLRVEAQSGVNVFVVDSAADDADLGSDGVCATAFGECTLRAAIEEANDVPNGPGGPDEIHFAIPGSGVHTISPAGVLPPIIDPLVIDGYTQPGARPNTLARAPTPSCSSNWPERRMFSAVWSSVRRIAWCAGWSSTVLALTASC